MTHKKAYVAPKVLWNCEPKCHTDSSTGTCTHITMSTTVELIEARILCSGEAELPPNEYIMRWNSKKVRTKIPASSAACSTVVLRLEVSCESMNVLPSSSSVYKKYDAGAARATAAARPVPLRKLSINKTTAITKNTTQSIGGCVSSVSTACVFIQVL